MKNKIIYLSFIGIIYSCNSNNINTGFSNLEKEGWSPKSQVKDTISFIEGLCFFINDSSIIIEDYTLLDQNIINNIKVNSRENSIVINSEKKDTILLRNKRVCYYYRNNCKIELISGFQYQIINGILNCKTQLGEFELIDFVWHPLNPKLKPIKVSELEISNESIYYGSDFCSINKILNINSGKNELDFLKSSFILISKKEKLFVNKSNSKIYNNVFIERNITKKTSVNSFDYNGLIVR